MASIKPKNWLLFNRIVRFGDCDPAGVIHYYKLFRWCHEAWEESLQIYGLNLKDIFPVHSMNSITPRILLPIVFCKANYLSPLTTGDNLMIKLDPEIIDSTSFQLKINIQCNQLHSSSAIIKHIAIDSNTKKRCKLPKSIILWIEDSNSISD